jgi:hypothetical protein
MAEDGLVRIRYRLPKKDSAISENASPAILRLTADHSWCGSTYSDPPTVSTGLSLLSTADLILCGDEGIRTPDIVDANHALSH